MLFEELQAIHAGLEQVFGPTALPLSMANAVGGSGHLKPYEDVLDALISAWTGVRYLECAAVPFGDETAAIWCPIRRGTC
jgi:hypothetical protein